jgi:hypothetical protein
VTPPRGFSLHAIFAGIFLLFLFHTGVFGWYVADDAAISLAYARNLAAGFGPVLYPGAPAVEGYSNPLWVLVLTVASALHLDRGYGIPLLKILGLLCGFGALALTRPLGRVAYGADSAWGSWLAPALLVVWTPFVFWSGAGLENGLYALLLTAATLMQLREIEEPERKPWSSLLLLGVALTRPEGVAFFLPFLVHRLLAIRDRRRHVASLLTWTGMFLAGFIGFLVLRHWTFGAWLPNTYYAKASWRHLGDMGDYLLNPRDDGRSYVETFVRTWWPAVLFMIVGLLDLTRWRANLLFAALLGGTVLYVVFVGGDFWPASRFFASVLPVAAVAAQHAIALAGRRGARLQAVAVIALLGMTSLSTIRLGRELRERYEADQLIGLQGRLDQAHRIRAIADRIGIADPLYLDPDIGGPTVAGFRVLDLGGLTDIHIARFQWYPEFLRQYIFEEQRPHIIRTHSTWTRTSQITSFREFAEQYTPLREYRDTDGLHGEFVRRDLLDGVTESETYPRRPSAPSWSQARALAREIRAREDRREREGWIEYYSDRQLHATLVAAFLDHEAKGTLPRDPARLRTLYSGLLAAGQPAAAQRVAALAAGESR